MHTGFAYEMYQGLLVSEGARRDSEVLFVYPPTSLAPGDTLTTSDEDEADADSRWVVRVNGAQVTHARPGERDIASVLRCET